MAALALFSDPDITAAGDGTHYEMSNRLNALEFKNLGYESRCIKVYI